jgi:hypothetical protein
LNSYKEGSKKKKVYLRDGRLEDVGRGKQEADRILNGIVRQPQSLRENTKHLPERFLDPFPSFLGRRFRGSFIRLAKQSEMLTWDRHEVKMIQQI